MKDIARIWHGIDSWLRANAPGIANSPASAADEEEIAQVERTVGRRFPEDLRASLRIHNGQRPDRHAFLASWVLLGTSQMMETWRFLDDLARREDFSARDRDVIMTRNLGSSRHLLPSRRSWMRSVMAPQRAQRDDHDRSTRSTTLAPAGASPSMGRTRRPRSSSHQTPTIFHPRMAQISARILVC